MSSIEAEARGPRSMLHPLQGFQFGVGGDQDTTPASTGLDGGNKWSRLAFVIKDKDSAPSTPKPSTSTGGGRSKLLRLSTTCKKKYVMMYDFFNVKHFVNLKSSISNGGVLITCR